MPKIISIATSGKGLFDITDRLRETLRTYSARSGILHIFVMHTSASLIVQENADPDVGADLIDHFDRMVPENAPYRHIAEGADDMPAHIKSALTNVSLSLPVDDGELLLGAWQGVYLFEHRHLSHERKIALTFSREA
ncbi:MAG: secondary thiamine-phosphate synthase enzyme YjbQ [Pseudomonadota bacterium]